MNDDDVYHFVEDLRALRTEAQATEQDLIDGYGDELIRDALFSYWNRFDPSSTVSGDAIAKLFPTLAERWELAE